jgi:hypothetical protein
MLTNTNRNVTRYKDIQHIGCMQKVIYTKYWSENLTGKYHLRELNLDKNGF